LRESERTFMRDNINITFVRVHCYNCSFLNFWLL
jgi:ribosomal protein S27E